MASASMRALVETYEMACRDLGASIDALGEDGPSTARWRETQRKVEAALFEAIEGIETERDALQKRVEQLLAQRGAHEFWAGWVYPEGETAEEVQNELTDYHRLIEDLPELYYILTNGKLSKPNTDIQYILAEVEQTTNKLIEEATVGLREELQAEIDSLTLGLRNYEVLCEGLNDMLQRVAILIPDDLDDDAEELLGPDADWAQIKAAAQQKEEDREVGYLLRQLEPGSELWQSRQDGLWYVIVNSHGDNPVMQGGCPTALQALREVLEVSNET